MGRLAFFLLLCFAFGAPAGAQNAANPFEITSRLAKITAAPGALATSLPANPFDMAPHRIPGVTRAFAANDTKPFHPFSILPAGGGLSAGLLFSILIGMFSFLTFTVAANRSTVGKIWRGFLNDSSLTLAQRESAGLIGSTPYYLFYANFVAQAGLLIFLVTRFFTNRTYDNLGFLLMCFLWATIMFLTKQLILRMAAWLFPVGNALHRYNFLVIIFNCVLGLFLVPFNIMLAFGGKFEGLLVFWTLGLVAIFYGYRTLRSSIIGSKFLADDQFHFLLYLCTVEIAPVMLVIKLALMQTN
jgi:hypothetical protein